MSSGRPDLLRSCSLYDHIRCVRHLPADSIAAPVERETGAEGRSRVLVPTGAVHYHLLHSPLNSDQSRGGHRWGFDYVSPVGHNRIQRRGELDVKRKD